MILRTNLGRGLLLIQLRGISSNIQQLIKVKYSLTHYVENYFRLIKSGHLSIHCLFSIYSLIQILKIFELIYILLKTSNLIRAAKICKFSVDSFNQSSSHPQLLPCLCLLRITLAMDHFQRILHKICRYIYSLLCQACVLVLNYSVKIMRCKASKDQTQNILRKLKCCPIDRNF